SLFTLVRERRFSAHARSRFANRTGRLAQRTPAHAGIHQFVSSDLRIAAASRPAFRRHDHLPKQTQLVRAAGTRVHAWARCRAMGQGRLRGPWHRQSGFARAWNDVGDAGCIGIMSRTWAAARPRAYSD